VSKFHDHPSQSKGFWNSNSYNPDCVTVSGCSA